MTTLLKNFRLLAILPATLSLLGCLGGGGAGTKDASIRLLNVSRGYEALELYTTNEDSDTEVKQISSVASGSISAYTALAADTYTVKLRKTGASGSLLSGSVTLAEDTHTTYVAYGPSGSAGFLAIGDDVAEPDSGSTKVQVINTTESGSLDVYLTSATDSLQDVTATVGGAGAGTKTDTTTLTSGTYRLRITGAGDTTDIRLDVPAIELASKQVLSVIITGSVGGVLVNALVLPQQGDLTSYPNSTARVRGAAGLSGSAVTANVSGINIVSRAATGVINSAYTTVAAGAAAVNIYVDGVAAVSSSESLVAGADYTLLVWSDADGVHTTLVNDDNHVSTTGRAKLRVLNGMSGLGGPITLAIDYSPIAEYIALGAISDVTEVTAGTDYQFDVTNASTTALLLTRSSVSLQSSGVYTFFLAGGGASAVVGTLRKDR